MKITKTIFNPSRQGFTLIETLLTLTLFLIIMGMVSSTFDQFLKSTRRVSSVMSTYDGVRIFSTQISNELGSAMCRINENRWLNLKVEENDGSGEDAGTRIFFTAPDDNARSISALNFISHYVYFWNKEEQALYRAVYNTRTDPEPLAKTGVDAQNKNRAANQQRLSDMTLAYRSSGPYGWTRSNEIKELMDQEPYQAILKNVFDFKVHCFKQPKSESLESTTVWEDSENLPLFIEFEIFVAQNSMVAGLRKEVEANGELSEESRRKLRRFLITVPMRNYGINDSSLY